MDSKIIISEELREEFEDILKHELIYPVYQPIVSLEDGSILGFEALSRIDKKKTILNISNLFQIAEDTGKLWELEALCRKKSLKHAVGKINGCKLFLNVDPKVIHDVKFKDGLTLEYIEKYNLSPDKVVFEITERNSIDDPDSFKTTIQHYKRQRYKIAIDDFGEGYSGINRVCAVLPDYIKLDIAIVRDIHKDTMKQTLVENMVRLFKDIHVKMIAEGIEKEEELKELIRLGVAYGQGYFLQLPNTHMYGISDECKDMIVNHRLKTRGYSFEPSFFGNVGTICKASQTTTMDILAHVLYENVEHNPLISEICVLDENQQVVGFYTRSELLELFGGRFGFNLNSKRSAKELMNRNFLMVEAGTSIEIVSKMALARPIEHLYDAVVVTMDDRYLGVVTVKDLLETAITIQVTRAVDANPLTGLPGNKTIEKTIRKCIQSDKAFTVIYLDLDNFKAYNDAYGFNNGDMMIKLVVDCMELCCRKSEFLGHIGGDDFVIVTSYWDAESLCEEILQTFSQKVKDLYSAADWEKGYIVSKNRNGFKEEFPIASLSIAGLTNQDKKYPNLDSFSQEIATVKKKCKQVEGNYYCIL